MPRHTLEIVKRSHLFTSELFDEEGYPKFIEPPGDPLPGPVRMTEQEWCAMARGECGGDTVSMFIHHKFTMTVEMVPCYKRLERRFRVEADADGVKQYPRAYDLQITIAAPQAQPQWAVFGPYERSPYERAIEKARDYLVKNGLLEILSLPENMEEK